MPIKKKEQTSLSKNKTIQWLLLVLIIVGFSWLLVRRLIQPGGETYGLESDAAARTSPTVNFVYLIPTDRTLEPKNERALSSAAKNLSYWYGKQLTGQYKQAFKFKTMTKYLPRDSAYYRGTGGQWDYYIRTLEDGFALTNGGFNDPNNRWIFINAAYIGNDQGAGGTSGVAVLHGTDYDGLATQNNGRYVGGLGHELGHAFNLPHPSDCPGQTHCNTDLMYYGYGIYPTNVVLTEEDKVSLLTSTQIAPFFEGITGIKPTDNGKKGSSYKEKNPYSNLPSDSEQRLMPKESPKVETPVRTEKTESTNTTEKKSSR